MSIADLALIPQFHAVALNATEMKAANDQIKTWLEAKLASLKTIIEEARAALDVATRNGWKTEALRSAFQREKQRQLYYGKILEAVNAGYTIVPNMEVDVFAIRVKREKPAESSATSTAKWKVTPRIRDEKEQRLPPGRRAL
jgi:hypothetical protein